MLVLSRLPDEIIDIIGPSPARTRIAVMVVEVRGDKVRLGIEAPKDWLIHRREITLEAQREGKL